MNDGTVGEAPADGRSAAGETGGGAWLREHATAVTGLVLAAALAFAYAPLAGYDPESSHQTVGGAEGFLFEPTGGSPQLIFAVTAWMLWNRRALLSASLGTPASVVSPALLVTGVALGYWAIYTGAIDLLIPSMSLLLIGGAGLVGGAPGVRTIRLPALFLLFAMPIPPVLVNAIIWPLQMFTVHASLSLLSLLQVDARHVGDIILTSGKAFHVIETCSGLRVMVTLTFSSVIYAELFRRSRAQTALLMLAAPIIGMVVNVGRVLTIILNPYSDLAPVHTAQGVVMVVVGVLLLAGVDRLLRIPMRSRADATPRVLTTRRPGGVARSRGRLAILTALLLVVGAARHAVVPWRPEPTYPPTVYDVPAQLDGWSAIGLQVDEAFLGSVGFTERVARVYENGDEYVDLFLGLDRRLERESSMRSTKTMLPSSGWQILERGDVALASDGRDATWAVIGSGKRRAVVIHWYEGDASLATETFRSILALDRSPLRRPGHALVVRASTNVDDADGRDAAFARLQRFLPLVREALPTS